MSLISNSKKIITKYFFRILLFFIFYHGLFLPMQIIINEKFITPLIEENITNVNYYELKLNKHHTTIFFKDNKIHELHFSIPFGQAYFFLMFFLWFKPHSLTKAISFYNLILIPMYSLAVILFLKGYVPAIGFLELLS